MATIKVQKGQTLSQLASQYGTSVSELVRLNGIKDPNFIKVGDTLNVPGKQDGLGPLASDGSAPEKTLDVSPTPEKTLPPPTGQTSRLLQFSSALNTATDIAKKKRLDFQANVLKQGVPSAARNASDFTGVLGGIAAQDESFVKPIVNTALDIAQSSSDDVTAIAKAAAQNGAPAAVIKDISAATDSADALIRAGKYIQSKKTEDTATFTDSQINKGSANAGVDLTTFKGYDDQTKNIFINGDLNSSKKLLDSQIDDGATEDDITSGISDLGLPTPVQDYLTKYAKQKLEDAKPPTPEETKKSIAQTLKDLQTQGYTRDEAEQTVRDSLTDNGKSTIPDTIDSAIDDALVDVYGRTFWQKVVPGGR